MMHKLECDLGTAAGTYHNVYVQNKYYRFAFFWNIYWTKWLLVYWPKIDFPIIVWSIGCNPNWTKCLQVVLPIFICTISWLVYWTKCLQLDLFSLSCFARGSKKQGFSGASPAAAAARCARFAHRFLQCYRLALPATAF